MILTKYEHACMTVAIEDEILVIDPGNLSGDFISPRGVAIVVITHQHADHFDPDQLIQIIDKNPDAIIVAHPSITQQVAPGFSTHSVISGDNVEIGHFRLSFYGGEHAVIHDSMPTIPNLGVFINELMFYPGDSFTLPGDQVVDTLALPVAAPWMKISEAMDYLALLKPRLAFPTHDAILSESGKTIVDNLLTDYANTQSVTYQRLRDDISL